MFILLYRYISDDFSKDLTEYFNSKEEAIKRWKEITNQEGGDEFSLIGLFKKEDSLLN